MNVAYSSDNGLPAFAGWYSGASQFLSIKHQESQEQSDRNARQLAAVNSAMDKIRADIFRLEGRWYTAHLWLLWMSFVDIDAGLLFRWWFPPARWAKCDELREALELKRQQKEQLEVSQRQRMLGIGSSNSDQSAAAREWQELTAHRLFKEIEVRTGGSRGPGVLVLRTKRLTLEPEGLFGDVRELGEMELLLEPGEIPLVRNVSRQIKRGTTVIHAPHHRQENRGPLVSCWFHEMEQELVSYSRSLQIARLFRNAVAQLKTCNPKDAWGADYKLFPKAPS